jgi:hypothetical protein
MISFGYEANYRQIKSDGSQIQPSEQVENTFRELHQLLELYAPAWYTEELHDHAEAALRVLGKVSTATQVQACSSRSVSDT